MSESELDDEADEDEEDDEEEGSELDEDAHDAVFVESPEARKVERKEKQLAECEKPTFVKVCVHYTNKILN